MRYRRLTWALVVPLLLALGAARVRAAESRPEDATITYWVQEALREDPRVESSHVNVTTNHGTVKLTGEVRNLAAREFADLETKKINGVRGVVNELVVNPVHRDDGSIADDVRSRLDDSPLDALHHVDVSVADGTVALRGQVASWSEKREAEVLASEVRGVREVSDDLTIHYKNKRPDEAILKDARAAIGRDVFLVGLPISVDVKDGVVTLTGTVGSVYQKDRASGAAWVGEVKSVRNDLEVEWWDNEGVRTAYAVPADTDICSAVRTDVTEDLRITNPYHIDTSCEYGQVTLTGTVPTYHEKMLAEQDAKDVVGVGWVTNELMVDSDWRDAAVIRSDIMDRFDTDYLLNGQDLEVRVDDGSVTLTGNVNTTSEREHAVEVASRVPGVLDVVDQIRVNRIFRYTDSTVENRVRDRLRAHDETRWIADTIKIAVKDGTVELTGDVPLWSERREAARVAYLTDGVRGVDNRLTVEGVKYPWDEWYYPPLVIHEDDYYYEPFHPMS